MAEKGLSGLVRDGQTRMQCASLLRLPELRPRFDGWKRRERGLWNAAFGTQLRNGLEDAGVDTTYVHTVCKVETGQQG